MKELTIEARADNLDKVMDFVNEDLEQLNCPINLQSLIDIAVEEIFMNIVNYAYKPEVGNVVVCISAGKEITIRFEDTGKPYNPLDAADPDLYAPLKDRKPGGLGVYLVKKLMDKVVYMHVGNKNVFMMTKEIDEAGLRA